MPVFFPPDIFCRILQACDLALRSAADSGTKVTNEANERFNKAISVLSNSSTNLHAEGGHHL